MGNWEVTLWEWEGDLRNKTEERQVDEENKDDQSATIICTNSPR